MISRPRKDIFEEDHIDSEGSWAISYGDLITVLLSFFVLYFSTDFEKSKEQTLNNALIKNLSGQFNVMAGHDDNTTLLSTEVSDLVNIKQLDKDHFFVFFKGLTFFETGSVDPLISTEKILKDFSAKVAPFLGDYKIIIHAYTDDKPVHHLSFRRFKDNLELSGLRAIAIKRILQKHGLDSGRVEISGKGILSKKVLTYMGIESKQKVEIRNAQRTISFVLKRESIENELAI